MHADELRALRKELGCTARELAETLGVEADTVVAWERGEAFPTKRFVEALRELAAKGPEAVRRRPKLRAARAKTPLELLADPELWRLVRKLLVHTELRQRALDLASTYADPDDDAR